MSHTLYATFSNPEAAERAAGALLDRGAKAEDLSVVQQGGGPAAPHAVASNVSTASGSVYGVGPDPEAEGAEVVEDVVPSEVKADAIKGSLVGAGVGAILAIAALVVPGVGIVLGAGALASALGGVLATAGAGAAAGAIVGYLKEMGVEDEVATEYGKAVEEGGAVLAITVPSGGLSEDEANAILEEHTASNVNRYAARSYVA